MPARARVSKFSQGMPSDAEVFSGGEDRQSGYGSRPERVIATQVQGLVNGSRDQYDEMCRDGLQYGDPGQIRYATGRRDACPPSFDGDGDIGSPPDISVGTRHRMSQKR